MKVFKYTLTLSVLQQIELPVGCKILGIQVQHDNPVLYALVQPESPLITRVIRIYGTGHDVEIQGAYLGTFQLDGGHLVFHAFMDLK